ncbi:ATP-binding protein [Apilactobacillus ozensis]|uniref:ATP-binding protein n=1 Tax=Apilactobacillus ozensis TaxID=866801 RepID=UPI0006D17B35|nr:AAA family ATPase [Apilactobacillus ozensis]
MIIKQLNIFGYGKWQDSTITLKSKNLNVIFGNNESGKTTLISFIKGILFGFKDGHNTYEQYIPKNTKSYGGELLVDVNNKLLKIKRIAGTHGGELSIVDNDSGETISNEKLDDIMGPINRESFDSIFYFGNFDTKAFSKISDEQLAYIIQKVGFAGSEKFIALKDDLSKRYKKLYAKNGRNPILNKKLKDYKLLLDKIEQAKQNQNEYTQLELEYNNVDKKYSLASHKLSKLNNHLKTLQGYKNNWTLFQKLKAYNSLKK